MEGITLKDIIDMKDTVVRIQKIELNNFKNVNKGTITYGKNANDGPNKNVMGIYGQNGSGKTAIIDALSLFKQIVSGDSLDRDLINLISANKKSSILDFEFLIEHKSNYFKAFYNFEITVLEDNNQIIESDKTDNRNTIQISKEKLSFSKYIDNKWTPRITIIDYDYNNKNMVFTPKVRFQEAISINKENEIKLNVVKEISKELRTSFIFNKRNIPLLTEGFSKNKDFIDVIKSLLVFAQLNLYVIKNEELGLINTHTAMPFIFRIEEGTRVFSGNIGLRLFDISNIEQEHFEIIEKIITQLNVVINKIIPELNIELKNYGNETLKDGLEGKKVELISQRNNIRIPLKYESDGIKKIISLLSALIAMYNNPQIVVAVDELDAGIFEYLLGEILEVISNNAKGQLIFTSHNLRALEKLNKESIVFTTTNPENRYIKLSNVKNNNNLRDFYLRGILLGGQKEDMYEETDKYEIAYAFRKAWN